MSTPASSQPRWQWSPLMIFLVICLIIDGNIIIGLLLDGAFSLHSFLSVLPWMIPFVYSLLIVVRVLRSVALARLGVILNLCALCLIALFVINHGSV